MVLYYIVIIQLLSHAPRIALDLCDIHDSYHNINYYMNHTILEDISHLLLTISASFTVSIFTSQVSIINQVCSFINLNFRTIFLDLG